MSQDRSQIYLTFAEYDDAYEEYICIKPESDPRKARATVQSKEEAKEISFLRMYQHGPFNLGSRTSMENLGQFMLTIALQQIRDGVPARKSLSETTQALPGRRTQGGKKSTGQLDGSKRGAKK